MRDKHVGVPGIYILGFGGHLFAGSVQKRALCDVPDINGPAHLEELLDTAHAVVGHLAVHPSLERTKVCRDMLHRNAQFVTAVCCDAIYCWKTA